MTYDREALTKVIADNQYWTRRMSDGYLSTGQNDPEDIADAVIAYLESTGALAKAWSEGYDEAMDDIGADDVNDGFGTSTNPYRRTE